MESRAYGWLRDRKVAGLPMDSLSQARDFGCSRQRIHQLRRSLALKTGRDFWSEKRPICRHGLTAQQYRVFVAAWELHGSGEASTFEAIRSLLSAEPPPARVPSFTTIQRVRNDCIARGLWPPRPIRAKLPMTAEEKEWIRGRSAAGYPWRSIPAAFRERFGRSISGKAVWTVLSPDGFRRYKARCRRGTSTVQARAAREIERRAGLCPKVIEEPAGLRRAQPRG